MKIGAVALAIALVVAACARSGGTSDPGLVAVCRAKGDAAAVNVLLGNGWVRPPSQNGEYVVPLDRAPRVGRERVENDADASAIIERLSSDRPNFVRGYAHWVVMYRSDDRLLLGGIGSRGHTTAIVHAVASEDQGWKRQFARRAGCITRVHGFDSWTAVQWQLDERSEPRASDSELAIRILEGCPGSFDGWDVVPIVFTNDEVVMVTVMAQPMPNSEPVACNLNVADSWLAVTADIGEPLGDRSLIDGSRFPMQFREWPPPPIPTGGGL